MIKQLFQKYTIILASSILGLTIIIGLSAFYFFYEYHNENNQNTHNAIYESQKYSQIMYLLNALKEPTNLNDSSLIIYNQMFDVFLSLKKQNKNQNFDSLEQQLLTTKNSLTNIISLKKRGASDSIVKTEQKILIRKIAQTTQLIKQYAINSQKKITIKTQNTKKHYLRIFTSLSITYIILFLIIILFFRKKIRQKTEAIEQIVSIIRKRNINIDHHNFTKINEKIQTILTELNENTTEQNQEYIQWKKDTENLIKKLNEKQKIKKNVTDIQKLFDTINDKKNKKYTVLIVEDEILTRRSVAQLIKQHINFELIEAANANEAFYLLKQQRSKIDCILLDLNLPDMNGIEFLTKIHHEISQIPPVIVYTGSELSETETQKLLEYVDTIVVKDFNVSGQRLIDELLQTLEKKHKKQKQITISTPLQKKLKDKKILLVEDDITTNKFITRFFAENNLTIFSVNNGKEALKLTQEEQFDFIIMDIMMPELDGYETIKILRGNKKYQTTPIIVISAKKMPNEQQKILKTGVNGYLTKPIELNKLINYLSLLSN